MLGQLEIFIAFATVMLGVSLLITVATQFVGAVLNLRGRDLRVGLDRLLKQCVPGISEASPAIAQELLLHPMISDSRFLKKFPSWRLATAIRKDELRRLLASPDFGRDLVGPVLNRLLAGRSNEPALKKAVANALAGVDVQAAWEAAARMPPGARGRTLAAALLGEAPVVDPAELARIGSALEALFTIPERLDEIGYWFDSAMDRTSQRFSQSSRIVTIVASTLACLAIHLDAFRLLEQLSTDERLRTALVTASAKLERQYEDHAAATPAAAAEATRRIQDGLREIREINAELRQAGFQLLPDSWPGLAGYTDIRHLWGMLTAAAFLSLGAPFWYSSLRTLSNLRPVLARREEAEKKQEEGKRVKLDVSAQSSGPSSTG